mmetsp:Transcript_70162/g.113939  ORF Transcript_70162/g.113939 Transcript_70162/m.113939 type:complete len:211 (+) Transcript_70162:871-1503(+)
MTSSPISRRLPLQSQPSRAVNALAVLLAWQPLLPPYSTRLATVRRASAMAVACRATWHRGKCHRRPVRMPQLSMVYARIARVLSLVSSLRRPTAIARSACVGNKHAHAHARSLGSARVAASFTSRTSVAVTRTRPVTFSAMLCGLLARARCFSLSTKTLCSGKMCQRRCGFRQKRVSGPPQRFKNLTQITSSQNLAHGASRANFAFSDSI